MKRGFSTIELLIATALALMFLSAMYVVTFGDQSTILSGETNAEAVAKTQALVEDQQAKGRQDFNLVNATSSTDGIYTKKVTVNLLPDLLTKQVVASTTWKGNHNQTLNTTITTLITNIDNISAPNTCNSTLTGDWTHPQILAQISIDPSSKGGNGVDILNHRAYFTGDSTSASKEDIYIYDVTDPANPIELGKKNTGPGLKDVAVANINSNIYAFVANESNAVSTGQLQIVNVTNPTNITFSNFSLTGLGIVTGSGSQANGNSLFYKDGYLYLGLTKTATGPNFVIIDVHTPTAPVYKGGFSIPNDINSIVVKGQYAYVATPNNEGIKVLDVSNPANPVRVSGIDLVDHSANGKSIYIVGSTLYFGRTVGSGAAKEINFLNITQPTLDPLPIPFGNRDISGSVNALVIRGNYAFLATGETNKEFQIWDISNPSNMTFVASLASPNNDDGTSMDCEGNYLFESIYNKQGLMIIGPGS